MSEIEVLAELNMSTCNKISRGPCCKKKKKTCIVLCPDVVSSESENGKTTETLFLVVTFVHGLGNEYRHHRREVYETVITYFAKLR